MFKTTFICLFLILISSCLPQKDYKKNLSSVKANETVQKVNNPIKEIFVPDGYFYPTDSLINGLVIKYLSIITKSNLDSNGNLLGAPKDVQDTAFLCIKVGRGVKMIKASTLKLEPDTFSANFDLDSVSKVVINGKFTITKGDFSEQENSNFSALKASIIYTSGENSLDSQFTNFDYSVGD